MGQYAVIIAVIAILLGAVLLFNAQMSAEDADEELSAYQVDRFAREAVLVGLKEAERNLANDTDGWVIWNTSQSTAQTQYGVPTTNYQNGTYAVVIDSFQFGATPTDPDKVWLTGTGTYEGWNAAAGANGTTNYIVKAAYETGLTDIGVPPGFRDAIQTQEDLTVSGNGCISGGVHANGELDTNGGAFDVLGEGTYTTSETVGNPGSFTGGIAQIDSVFIPITPIPPTGFTHQLNGNVILNAANAPAAGTTIPDGWFGITGRGGTGDAFILYIDGDLDISGSVYLVGYAGIYVNGTITIGGNSTIAPVPASAGLPVVTANMTCAQRMAAIQTWTNANLPNGSQLGLFAEGNIIMGGNTNVVAHLTTNAQFRYSGGGNANRLIIGGITAQEDLTLSGNTMVYYTTPSDEIEIPGGNDLVPEGVRLVSYREWAVRP